MREPRLMRGPNKGLLSVDVTALHMGLSRCRSIAEQALGSLRSQSEVDVEAVLESIVEEARSTVHVIEGEAILDEVGAILKEEDQ